MYSRSPNDLGGSTQAIYLIRLSCIGDPKSRCSTSDASSQRTSGCESIASLNILFPLADSPSLPQDTWQILSCTWCTICCLVGHWGLYMQKCFTASWPSDSTIAYYSIPATGICFWYCWISRGLCHPIFPTCWDPFGHWTIYWVLSTQDAFPQCH